MEKLLYPGRPHRTLLGFTVSSASHTRRCTHKYTFIYMCTCTHKHVCRHTYKHTNTHTCAQLPTHTQKHVCVQPHMHTCGHTNTCTCVCAHSALGQGLPRLFGRPSTTWAGPVTPAASAFLLQDLLLVAATCLCIPCVCVCPTGEPCVWGCVPHRRMSRRLRQQGREDHQLCRGFTSSPQAGSRHTVAGGQERLECLQNLQHGRLGVLAGIYTEVLGARSRLLMHPQPHGDSAVRLALGSKG